jgi:hypothetical protein
MHADVDEAAVIEPDRIDPSREIRDLRVGPIGEGEEGTSSHGGDVSHFYP